MPTIARRLSFPLRIIAVFLLLTLSFDGLAQSCDCPAAATCNPCGGGFIRYTLKYTGALQTWVSANDQGGVIFGPAIINPGATFTFQGSIPNEKFVGASVMVYIAGPVLNAIFGTNCGTEFQGNTSGFFEIVSIISKTGGLVCCEPDDVDDEVPIILGCPSNKTATLPAGSCSVPVSWTEPTFNDDCNVTWTKSHLPGASFSVGKTKVTYTATDTYGNQSTCSFDVNVNDVTPPVFANCPGNIVRTAVESCKAQGAWTPPTATDNNCLSPPVITSNFGPTDPLPLGPNVIKYTAEDAKGNKATCTFTVTVEDKTPPVFEYCPTVITAIANNSCVAKIELPKPSITDNCDDKLEYTSTHPNEAEFPVDTTLVTYTALDKSGNKTTCSFVVVVSNPTAPTIEACPGTVTESARTADEDSVVVTWDEPIATVLCGELSTERSHEPGSKFPIGTTLVTYTFKDEGGQSSTCTFDVVVLESNVLFTISNVVTPDGDGINDVWVLPNIEEFKSNTVVVVDRWGNKIFHATGYDNTRTVWNGTNNSGNVVPTGTYFYTVEVRDQGKVVLKKGFIEVIQ